jgi:hypothetical protein
VTRVHATALAAIFILAVLAFAVPHWRPEPKDNLTIVMEPEGPEQW